MESGKIDKLAQNLAQLMIGLKEDPELGEVFESPSAPKQILSFLRHTIPPGNGLDRAALQGTAVNRSDSGLLAMDKALTNDLLLEKIFGHCSIESLKACRLVSRRWLDLSFKTWRKAAVLCVEETDDETDAMQLSAVNEILEAIQSGNEDTYQLLARPFSSYELRWYVDADGDMDSPQYRTFVEQLKNHTTYLMVAEIRKLSDLVTLVFRRFARLTHLRFGDLEVVGTYPSNSFAGVRPHENLKVLDMRSIIIDADFPWVECLRRLPHLQKIILGFLNDKDEDGEDLSKKRLGEFLEATGVLRLESKQILNLTELDLLRFHTCPVNLMEELMSTHLQQCNFALRRFSVDVGANTSPSIIADMLSPYSRTLKFLRLTRGLNELNFSDVANEESMDELKAMVADVQINLEGLDELRLLNGPCWGFHLLSYLDAPYLNKLVFECDVTIFKVEDRRSFELLEEDCCEAEVVQSFLEGKIFYNLVAFEYAHVNFLLGGRDIHALAKAMPNMTRLSMPLSAETFKDVCKLWPKLKSLEVKKCEGDFPEVDDEALTGFCGFRMVSALRPNVTDLKHLTDLVISCERSLKRNDVKFSDHSIINGFLLLPRLHFLSIAFKQISEMARTALERHVHYVHYQALGK